MKKQLLLFFIGLYLSMLVTAQNHQTIQVTAGNLYSLTSTEAANITSLTLTGTIDARDFKTMRDEMPLLAQLDLRGVSVSEYNGFEGTLLNVGKVYAANQIPENAFFKTTGNNILTTIIFPPTITTIDRYAFNGCSGLTSISIPPGVTTIERSAFYNCTSAKTLTLPSSIITLDTQAFRNCKSLTSITINCKTPPDLFLVSNVFYQIDKRTCVLYVPPGSVWNYRQAYQWDEFQNVVESTNVTSTNSNIVQLSALSFYPNPTMGEIHISGIPENQKNKISLYSIDGSKIWEKTITSSKETIDIGAQVAGTYLLTIDKQRFKIIKK